jgi:cell division septation protein DedD
MRHGLTRGSRGAVALVVAGLLTACEEVPELGLGANGAQPSTVTTPTAGADITAPEIFQASEPGLWDGRPSLGGVWVAHPDVADPERVRILNTGNGQQVIGALFRRERDLPGPALQVSSDAAEALGMLAGAPANLEVTALRRQEAPAPAPAGTAPVAVAPAGAAPTAAAPAVATSGSPAAQRTPAAQPGAPAEPAAVQAVAQSLEDIFSASPEPELPQPVAAPTGAAAAGGAGIATSTLQPAGAPAASASSLRNPFVQLGSFEVEAYVNETAQGLRAKGLPVQIVPVEGAAAWRLLLGPAETAQQQRDLLSRAVAEGFADAYLVRS